MEERRRRQQEENQAKFEEILRRNQQRYPSISDNRKAHTLHNPSILISHSSSSYQAMTDRRISADSSSTVPKENSTSSSSVRGRTRPSSYAYWLNTGDQPNVSNANFMRLTYAATCRSRCSRSVERCPRACRGQEDLQKNPATNADTQRRLQSINRQQLHETICRLAKPKTIPMPSSQSSHQLRSSTPPVSNALIRKSNPTSRRSSSHTKPPVSTRTKSSRSQMSTSQSFSSTPRRNDVGLPPKSVSTSSGQSTPPNQTEDHQTESVDQNEEYQRKLTQKIREAQQRLELERQQEEERQKQIELEEYQREQEQIRLVEEQRQAEEERLRKAIEEREREDEMKRQEEFRLAQQREEIERKQAEEAERLQRERLEKARKEEEERIERKKRLDLIMRRTRPVSPQSKNDTTPVEITNGYDSTETQPSTTIPHSSSSENILNSSDLTMTSETPKFKSPLIQSVLEKARNTRSTDNLSQSNMITSEVEANF